MPSPWSTAPSSAAAAEKYVALLLGPQGQGIMKDNGFGRFSPAYAVHAEAMPADLRKLVRTVAWLCEPRADHGRRRVDERAAPSRPVRALSVVLVSRQPVDGVPGHSARRAHFVAIVGEFLRSGAHGRCAQCHRA